MKAKQELDIGSKVQESRSLVMDFFCSEITQNVSFVLEHGGKKAEMCGDR